MGHRTTATYLEASSILCPTVHSKPHSQGWYCWRSRHYVWVAFPQPAHNNSEINCPVFLNKNPSTTFTDCMHDRRNMYTRYMVYEKQFISLSNPFATKSICPLSTLFFRSVTISIAHETSTISFSILSVITVKDEIQWTIFGAGSCSINIKQNFSFWTTVGIRCGVRTKLPWNYSRWQEWRHNKVRRIKYPFLCNQFVPVWKHSNVPGTV